MPTCPLASPETIRALKEKFLPLINECKKYKTAIRIGANYGEDLLMQISEFGGGKWEHVSTVNDLTKKTSCFKLAV